MYGGRRGSGGGDGGDGGGGGCGGDGGVASVALSSVAFATRTGQPTVGSSIPYVGGGDGGGGPTMPAAASAAAAAAAASSAHAANLPCASANATAAGRSSEDVVLNRSETHKAIRAAPSVTWPEDDGYTCDAITVMRFGGT